MQTFTATTLTSLSVAGAMLIKLKIRNPWDGKYHFVLITKTEADLMMNAYRQTGNRYFVASGFPSEYMDALVSFVNENNKNWH